MMRLTACIVEIAVHLMKRKPHVTPSINALVSQLTTDTMGHLAMMYVPEID